MPTPEEVQAACAEILSGLDDDMLEYIAGGVIDEDDGTVLPKDELVDYVAPMLEVRVPSA